MIAPEGTRQYAGILSISRNGRFVVNSSTNGMPGGAPPTYLYDRLTGAVANLGVTKATAVGDTGVVLAGNTLIAADRKRVLGLPGDAVDMDAAARVVVSQSRTTYTLVNARIFATDVESGRTWQIGPNDRDNYAPRLSTDGQWVLYTSRSGGRPELFFTRIDNTEWRQLTAGGVQAATLSADGSVAWAVTRSGALQHIDTHTGEIYEAIENTPNELSKTGAYVPGSANVITGYSLAGDDPVRLTLNDLEMPLLSVSSTRIAFQIPWEAPVDAGGRLELHGANRTFEISWPVNLSQYGAAVDSVVHDDFRSMVTDGNPAWAGEVVHIYATGLWPVDPPVPTGAAGRAEPLSRTAEDWVFSWNDHKWDPAEILFVGLAPGLTGVYQIDLRMPGTRSSVVLYIHPPVSYTRGSWGWFVKIPMVTMTGN